MRLVTISFSHYNEKARWALDRFGVEYREQRCLPLLHFGAVAWATGGRGGRADRGSTRFSTPLLVADDGTRVHDSAAIVRYVSDRFGTDQTTLYPPDHAERVEQLERRADERLGPHTRRAAYGFLLAEPRRLVELARRNAGWAQYAAFRALGPLPPLLLRRALGITPQRAQASVERVRAEVAALSDELGSARYLVGDRFTAADLAVASLLAPSLLVRPEEGYSAWLPPMHECPPDTVALAEEVRASPIGRHALRMFAEERGPARG